MQPTPGATREQEKQELSVTREQERQMATVAMRVWPPKIFFGEIKNVCVAKTHAMASAMKAGTLTFGYSFGVLD